MSAALRTRNLSARRSLRSALRACGVPSRWMALSALYYSRLAHYAPRVELAVVP